MQHSVGIGPHLYNFHLQEFENQIDDDIWHLEVENTNHHGTLGRAQSPPCSAVTQPVGIWNFGILDFIDTPYFIDPHILLTPPILGQIPTFRHPK